LPIQLIKHRLKSGRKVNITVGPKGDSFIGIEGAYVKLLTQYWGFAKTKLVNGDSALFIEDGIKLTVQWIYAYMLAGEKDNDYYLPIDNMTITQLVDLYDHAVYLEYISLKNRVLGMLRYQLRNTFPNVMEIYYISLVVPKLNDFVLKLVVVRFTQPSIFDYTPYMEYAQQEQDFGAALDKVVRETLDHLIARSLKYYSGPHFARHLQWVKKNSASLNCGVNASTNHGNNQVPPSKNKRAGQRVVKLPAAIDSKQFKAAAAEPSEVKSKRGPFKKRGSKKAKPASNGQVSATATRPDTDTNTSAPDAGRGRKMNRRRARTDRYYDYARQIELAADGEGVQTCTREVKAGEYTRTGLKI